MRTFFEKKFLTPGRDAILAHLSSPPAVSMLLENSALRTLFEN